MTAKEYLYQAYHLKEQIDAKLEQIKALGELATKCTANLSAVPVSGSKSSSAMADTVAKIIDLQTELNSDIDRLIDLQQKIGKTIMEVNSPDMRIVLERRYLCYQSFEKIADAMGYTDRNVFILHRKALRKIKIPESFQ